MARSGSCSAARSDGEYTTRATGYSEGLARGKAEALLAALAARGITVGEAERARVLGERDPVQRDRWLAGAAICADAAALFAMRG